MFDSPKRCKQNAAETLNGDKEKHSRRCVYRARPARKLPRTAVRGEQVCTGRLIRPLSLAEWAFKRFVISGARTNIIADFSLRETHLGEGSRTPKAVASVALAGVRQANGSRPLYESATKERRLRIGHTTEHANRKQVNKIIPERLQHGYYL